MADNRPWAKIDTGYILNPKWFQVERVITENPTVANGKSDSKTDGTCHTRAIAGAVRCAREAHLASILYCAQNKTDGIFPVRAIKALIGVLTDEEEAAITALFEVGLWVNHPGGMAEVRDYLEHQTPAALSETRSAAGRKGAASRWGANSKTDGTCHEVANGKSIATANAEEKRREEKRKEDIYMAEPASGPDHFDTFWTSFPSERKRAKPDCRKLFAQAVKAGTPPETIIQAAERYRSDPNREPQYTVNPKTWLREQRWEAGPLPPRRNTIQGEDRFDGWERAAQLVNQPNQLRAIEGGTP